MTRTDTISPGSARFSSGQSSFVVKGWSMWGALIGAAFLLPGRLLAQQTPVTFGDVVSAGFHTAYQAVQRTTVSNHGRQSWFEAAVVQNADGTRSVRVTAPPRRSGEIEIDDGTYRWRYQPNRHTVALNPSAAAHHQHSAPSQQVVMTAAGQDVVAGRPAAIYNVAPQRPGSPALRLWVDDASSIALRTDWVTRDGRQISQAFTRIEMGVGQGVHFSWPAGAQLQARLWPVNGARPAAQTISTPIALPERLPRGLFFDGVWIRQIAGRQALWFHFHQGKLDASLFETLQGPDLPVAPALGVENWNLGPLNITLVSSLPPVAQMRLRRSIRLIHL